MNIYEDYYNLLKDNERLKSELETMRKSCLKCIKFYGKPGRCSLYREKSGRYKGFPFQAQTCTTYEEKQ